MEGLIFRGKFVSKSIGLLCSGKKIYHFALFYFVLVGKFHVQAPQGAYIWRGNLTEGFFCYDSGGLIFGGAYFRNFKVLCNSNKADLSDLLTVQLP